MNNNFSNFSILPAKDEIFEQFFIMGLRHAEEYAGRTFSESEREHFLGRMAMYYFRIQEMEDPYNNVHAYTQPPPPYPSTSM